MHILETMPGNWGLIRGWGAYKVCAFPHVYTKKIGGDVAFLSKYTWRYKNGIKPKD